jgi:diamine N-acetyltransferase
MTIVRIATKGDLPFIMATERRPGYEWVVGRWDEALHSTELARPGTRYAIAQRDGEPLGFGILQFLDDRFGNVQLKRIAVKEPGSSVGRPLLEALLRMAFEPLSVHRLWLTVAPHNTPARQLYRSVGFHEKGINREAHVDPEGRRFSPVVMSILRPEWESRQASVGA